MIIAGVAGNICVLFTAHDAFMRDFRVVVPEDCTASNDPEDNRRALIQMRKILDADTTPSTEVDLDALVDATLEAPDGALLVASRKRAEMLRRSRSPRTR